MKIVKEALAVYFTREFTLSQADLLAQVISDSYAEVLGMLVIESYTW